MPSENKVNCHPSWKQIGPNVYSQPYGFQEVLYNAISVPVGSPGLFLIATWITFSHQPSTSSAGKKLSQHGLVTLLRQAWLQMRLNYPGLAAENLPDGKKYTSPSSPAEIEAWLDSTFLVVRDRTAAEHWKNLVKTRQMTLYYLPEEHQLFLQGEHHTLDGRGLMLFWDRFFKALSAPAAAMDVLMQQAVDGSEAARLPPRSDDVLDMTEKRPGRGEQRAAEILLPFSNMREPVHVPVSLPLGPCSQRNAAFELKVDSRTTGAIMEACKGQRLSVTAAWHASVMLATQAVQKKRKNGVAGTQFATCGNFDLRRYFPNPDPPVDDAYALNSHHCAIPYVLEPEGKTFSQMVRELASWYQQDLPKRDADLWSALGPMIRMMVPDFTRAPLEETTPALSSFGVVDRFIASEYSGAVDEGTGTWRVEDVWFGDTVTGPWLECFMWTWKGRLCLITCYNPAYYSHVSVDEFLQLVVQKMLDGLDIGDGKHGAKL